MDKKNVVTSKSFRPRTIVTTDGECDDMNSFIHLLLCSNDLDLRGVVVTSSCFHYAEDPIKRSKAYRWAGTDWVGTYIDAYAQVFPALRCHDERYPDPDHLRSINRPGNIAGVGDMSSETPGSQLIEKEILSDDDSRLFLQCWGGSNTVARALKSIEKRFGDTKGWETLRQQLSKKIVLYLIATQDGTFKDYISKSWPEITVLHNRRSFESLAFNWKRVLTDEQKETLYADWQLRHIICADNPLTRLYFTYRDGRAYPGELPQYQYGLTNFSFRRSFRLLTFHGGTFAYGDFLSEGDSPAFLFLLDRDVQTCGEDYTLNNWGGSFSKVSRNYWVDDHIGSDSIGRYITEINQDFARRVRWAK